MSSPTPSLPGHTDAPTPCTRQTNWEEPHLTFGKYKDWKISDLPYSYVVWLMCGPNSLNPDELGNYDFLKRCNPDTFTCLKGRLISDIKDL